MNSKFRAIGSMLSVGVSQGMGGKNFCRVIKKLFLPKRSEPLTHDVATYAMGRFVVGFFNHKPCHVANAGGGAEPHGFKDARIDFNFW